jgi:hypothetical protein
VKQALLRARWTLYVIAPTFLVFLFHTMGKRWG